MLASLPGAFLFAIFFPPFCPSLLLLPTLASFPLSPRATYVVHSISDDIRKLQSVIGFPISVQCPRARLRLATLRPRWPIPCSFPTLRFKLNRLQRLPAYLGRYLCT
ncbi:hypothetical protein LZ30DRAFT_725187 [Colletotrichum cereale]|nr:hypothetical protein LZ30DRAFT_725187 [Colletotrichum cereale]